MEIRTGRLVCKNSNYSPASPHLIHPSHYISATLKETGGLLCKYYKLERLWVHRHQTQWSLRLKHQEGGEWNWVLNDEPTLFPCLALRALTAKLNHSSIPSLPWSRDWLDSFFLGKCPNPRGNFHRDGDLETLNPKAEFTPSQQICSLTHPNRLGSVSLPHFENEQSQRQNIF